MRCAFIRILIILDWLRQNAIDLWQNSAHLKAEATCLLKNLWQNISRSPTRLENCGKTFLNRPPSADQAQQMHCLPPQFEVENAKWSFYKNQWKDILNVQPFVKFFGQVPQSEFQIPGSIVLRHWPVTRCLPECRCAKTGSPSDFQQQVGWGTRLLTI